MVIDGLKDDIYCCLVGRCTFQPSFLKTTVTPNDLKLAGPRGRRDPDGNGRNGTQVP